MLIAPNRLNFSKIKYDISSQSGDSRRAAKLLLMQALRWVSYVLLSPMSMNIRDHSLLC